MPTLLGLQAGHTAVACRLVVACIDNLLREDPARVLGINAELDHARRVCEKLATSLTIVALRDFCDGPKPKATTGDKHPRANPLPCSFPS